MHYLMETLKASLSTKEDTQVVDFSPAVIFPGLARCKVVQFNGGGVLHDIEAQVSPYQGPAVAVQVL